MKKAESKSYPGVKRQGQEIVFPVDIGQVQRTNEDNETETFYKFYPIKMQYYGEDLSDMTTLAKRRYADLRRLSPMPLGYGSQNEQLEMQQEQGFSAWQNHCANVKANFPKE